MAVTNKITHGYCCFRYLQVIFSHPRTTRATRENAMGADATTTEAKPATIQVAIPHRWRETPVYVAEIPADTESGMQMRVALEQATTARADLRGANLDGAYLDGAYLGGAYLGGANLRGANLRGAYLDGAYLGGANLRGANLRGAYLDGANLDGAYLGGAYLGGANLRGANLDGAYLDGAYLGGDGKLKLVGKRPVLVIGPIGSDCAYLTAYLTDEGVYLRRGCFFGTLERFEDQLAITHGANEHGREYQAALVLVRAHAEIWTPAAADAEKAAA